MTLKTLIDTADRFNWSERQRVFGDDGFLIQEVLTFDDGRVKTTTLADGVIVAVSLTAPLNVASWTTHSTTYDALTGQITGRSVIYDDGRTLIDTFVNGIRSTRTLTDTGDAHVWASRELIYDASGALSQKIDTYDDGRVSTSSYTAQVLTTRTTVSTSPEKVTIDFGADTDADTLVFLGTVTTGTIRNWNQGTDTVDVFDHTAWNIINDDGPDIVLSDGTSTLTFGRVTGLTDVENFLI